MSASTRLKNEALDRARLIAAELQASRGEQGTGLAAAPDLNQAYQEAGKATQPLEQPSPGPPPRTTSYAKTLDEGYVPPANGIQTHPQDQGRGSEMIEKDQPKPELVPPDSPEKRAVDARQFNQDWAKEQAGANAVNERAESIAAELKAVEAQQGSGPEQSQGPGMG